MALQKEGPGASKIEGHFLLSSPGLRTRSIFNRVQVRVQVHKNLQVPEFEFEFTK